MTTTPTTDELTISRADSADDLPEWLSLSDLAMFLHEALKPYEDPVWDVEAGLRYAFSEESGQGGYVILGTVGERVVGSVVMLETGMSGYIPENILLFIAVDPSMRGRGMGGKLMERALDEADGAVKLHVEYDNPAKRLYERMGFTSKYAEMRYTK